ncbi:MAG TPA: bifunctional N(6)-L-threonylcarbamoyladenine synthase/serine/threonine protein kinase [Methanothermococcus okinawensis]|uniref:Probable bifunctional tRNA threonylcarbamoyladenosine biosynthesis protein n=1 Tax=Methanothermococcus okinawensis TaxID=155863 RepID=A0A833DZG1_9EURY|nr:bifunctional N(6)-L-threonylcarbamoyladenine synthase/serine/threonine protein kinase [Methanothermococcus okinawensis]HIP91492.1 bifunctional N(6)-L-threonylcarbamoyladenine synthase/serine/threonine protein kinase [Methanothermococcus okinawensis]
MIVLGLEGTAEKTGVGIIDSEGNILFNKTVIYKPPVQGINPREAADHHAETFPKLIKEAFEHVPKEEIDLVAFSQGPGLGPSLRVTATAARTLALALKKPIIGVNHCIAHVEIGKLVTDAQDPLTLYVSGGNTQILAYVGERYRIFGETLDIAIGNCLDQFARHCGLPHPGGLYIEKLARRGSKLLDLPYSIKGMDITFSGLLTAAIKKYEQGERLEDVCFSLQEVAFSMLTEITERALAHTEKGEVMLVGGVAVNRRLREMLRDMCEEQGVDFYVPRRDLCGDNGVMIAYLGLLMYLSGWRMSIEDTRPIPNYRSDSVEVTWIEEGVRKRRRIPEHLIGKGAEADIRRASYLGWECVVKERVRKRYRLEELDKKIRLRRTVREGRFLYLIKDYGILSPYIWDIDKRRFNITMSYIPGHLAKEEIERGNLDCCYNIGVIVGKLHERDIVHNDLTTSNFIVMREGDTHGIREVSESDKEDSLCNSCTQGVVEDNKDDKINLKVDRELLKKNKVYIIDFGLGKFSNMLEDKAIDLIVLKKSIMSTHYRVFEEVWNRILEGYKVYRDWKKVVDYIDEVERRRRYC